MFLIVNPAHLFRLRQLRLRHHRPQPAEEQGRRRRPKPPGRQGQLRRVRRHRARPEVAARPVRRRRPPGGAPGEAPGEAPVRAAAAAAEAPESAGLACPGVIFSIGAEKHLFCFFKSTMQFGKAFSLKYKVNHLSTSDPPSILCLFPSLLSSAFRALESSKLISSPPPTSFSD